jgi:hypothetical protein
VVGRCQKRQNGVLTIVLKCGTIVHSEDGGGAYYGPPSPKEGRTMIGLVVTVGVLFLLALGILAWACCVVSGRESKAARQRFYDGHGCWPDW